MGAQPGEVMRDLVSLCDVAIGTKKTQPSLWHPRSRHRCDLRTVNAEKYRHVCEQLAERFPSLHTIAITLRGSLSASHNTGVVLWHAGDLFFGPIYDITHIVDRVAAETVCSRFNLRLEHLFQFLPTHFGFCIAASALNTPFSATSTGSVAEVEKILAGDISGRVSR